MWHLIFNTLEGNAVSREKRIYCEWCVRKKETWRGKKRPDWLTFCLLCVSASEEWNQWSRLASHGKNSSPLPLSSTRSICQFLKQIFKLTRIFFLAYICFFFSPIQFYTLTLPHFFLFLPIFIFIMVQAGLLKEMQKYLLLRVDVRIW